MFQKCHIPGTFHFPKRHISCLEMSLFWNICFEQHISKTIHVFNVMLLNHFMFWILYRWNISCIFEPHVSETLFGYVFTPLCCARVQVFCRKFLHQLLLLYKSTNQQVALAVILFRKWWVTPSKIIGSIRYSLTCVIVGEPRHRADNKLITVETEADDFDSERPVALVFRLCAPIK